MARLSWHRNLTAWIFIPAGVLLILLACFGVNSLIGLSTVSFPASVACLIVLFLALIVLDLIVGDRRTRAIVNIIDVPVSMPRLGVGFSDGCIQRQGLLYGG